MKTVKVVQIYQEIIEEVEMPREHESLSPKDVASFLQSYFKGFDREYAIVLGLDVKNTINVLNVVSVGTINSAIVHPREVFKTLILSNCASFIFAHTHPSGNSKPSQEDINVTNRLKECGKIMGIELLDSIVVGQKEYKSLREMGEI